MELLPSAASAHNPVDMLASAGRREYAGCLEILLAAPEVDGVLVITLAPPSHRAEDVADGLIPLIQGSSKPALVVAMGSDLIETAHQHFSAAGIPTYPFPERAASALAVLAARAAFLARPAQETARPIQPGGSTTAFSAEDLVAAYGIETAPLKLAASADEATRLTAEMTFPLVAKIASPDILHKSDIGGVLLNLNSVEAVIAGYATLIERAQTARPTARLDGITLQRQIPEGQDVILGCVRDPQFGPLMMFGSGGIEAEGLKDVAFALAPLDPASAEKMLQKTWAGQKLAGFRSLPPADRAAVLEALVRLSWLAIDHPEISEIEINPLRVLREGAVAVDVRMKSSDGTN
jgi:acetyltransferase